MRMLRRPHRRVKCKNLNRNHRNRIHRSQKRENKSPSPPNCNRRPGMRTVAEDAGEAAVVEVAVGAERGQLVLPGKLKECPL